MFFVIPKESMIFLNSSYWSRGMSRFLNSIVFLIVTVAVAGSKAAANENSPYSFCWLKPSLKRSLLLALIGLPLSLIGVSRIYLGEHWASDVLGSYLLGSLLLVATIQLYRWGQTRFFVRPPVAKELA